MIGLSLSPRQTRTALDLLTAAVVISVAIALAGLTWRIAGHAGTGAITVPSGRSAPAAADIAPTVALAPFGKSAVAESGQATALPLELKGVVAAVPSSLSTAFIAVNNEAAKGFHVGDDVGGATIQAILRDRVILGNAGRTEYLAFPDPTLSPEARAAAAAQQQQPPAPPTGAPPSAPTVAPAAPPPTSAAPASLLQRFNATPVEGGYRVGQNGPPGLQPGDVLVSVNGTSLSDQAAAASAYAAAQQSGSATLQILRDGKRVTLTVALR